MQIRAGFLALGLAASIGLNGAATLQAAEIVVLVNQGAFSGVRDLAAAYQQSSGNKVTVIAALGPEMAAKVNANEPADLISQFIVQFDDLVKRGKVVAGTVKEFARVGNGVAVKTGSPIPDISTPESFKQAMLNAKSIGHSSLGTGALNTKLFQRIGIYDRIKDKIVISNEEPIAAGLVRGAFEIGLQQTNVIQPFPGSDYVGPIPRELMEYGQIAVGLLTVSKQPEIATALLKFMVSPEAAPVLRKSTMEPPQ